MLKVKIYLYIFVLSTIIMGVLLLFMLFNINRDAQKTIDYFNHKISYDTEITKYQKMLKTQKRVVFKKKIYRQYLKLLLAVKEVWK